MFLTKTKKSPFYQIVYTIDGKRTTVSTKTKDLKEAKKFLASFSIPHKINNVVYELNNSIKLVDFRDEYINYLHQSKSKSYIERSIKPAFKFLIEHVGNELLSYITVRQLDNFINERFKVSKSSAGLYYRTLKAAFSKAVVWNYLQENPLKKIKSPKQVKSLPIFIIKDELNKILDCTKNELLKDIFITAFYTGMRLGELLNMHWSWIDLVQNLIIIKNSEKFTTKSKEERIIPIHKTLREILIKRYKINGKSGLVFYNVAGIKLNENFVSKQFKKAVRQAGLNDEIHFHSLRHSFASNLVQSGSSLYIVKELLGHQDFKTTQIYSHLEKSSLTNAVSLL